MKSIQRALVKMDAARAALQEAIITDLPVGAGVQWRHGYHWQQGQVVGHGYGDRVSVENEKTGKRRHVSVRSLHPC